MMKQILITLLLLAGWQAQAVTNYVYRDSLTRMMVDSSGNPTNIGVTAVVSTNDAVPYWQVVDLINSMTIHDIMWSTNISATFAGSNLWYQELPAGHDLLVQTTNAILVGTNYLAMYWYTFTTTNMIPKGTWAAHFFGSITKGVGSHTYGFGFDLYADATNRIGCALPIDVVLSGEQQSVAHLHMVTNTYSRAVGIRPWIIRVGAGANGSAVIYYGASHAAAPGSFD